ncbi:tetratricopeptide repeat protein [Geobacter benzoatilyticus]|jgi:cytochrome c-type biogenesis protein CcmH/NrfG|uniref:Tetratricopeptide repeat protein n=1 Tax=Geobacter benzoatilyticus TaxID=2815309 RepID=A0ABX7Q3A2_9BACT|nr:tetratricopeptide repeat protein [Geobacter benzoatilyticus]QSV45844.1 tetratricopeptide repeat protein [Geobacter benzoatilyticus]
MSKETVLYVVIALLVGILGTVLVTGVANKQKTAPPAAGIPAGGGSPVDYQQRITEAEKIVAADPKNLQAWVQLGNDYFDTDQAKKAIDAYGKALELDPNNANVLTDQGIMFKRVGWFDRAIANFEKAQQLDPKHLQSLYNLGVIYMADLKQPAKAVKYWERYLELDPMSPNSQQIRLMLDEAKGMGQSSPPQGNVFSK